MGWQWSMSSDNPLTDKARSVSDAQALLAMFQRIPIETLEATAMDLLKATRRVRLSKDEPQGVVEPDFAVRLKVWQTIVEQRVGQAASRRPVEPPKENAEARPRRGSLRMKGPDSLPDARRVQATLNGGGKSGPDVH